MKSNLAVNLATSEMMNDLAGSLNHALTSLCISNRHQNMADSELISLLEKYQNKSLGKSWIEHGLTNAFKTRENTQFKTVLMKVNFV